MKLFAACLPGLETFTSQEIEGLGLSASPATDEGPGAEAGGVEFEGSLVDVYRSNLFLRTASRILARLGSFRAAGFPELRRKAAHLPWEEYLAADRPVSIRVTCHKSRLYHQRAVVERIAGAISDRVRSSVQTAHPHPRFAQDRPHSSLERLCRKSVHGSASSPRTGHGTLEIRHPAVRPEPFGSPFVLSLSKDEGFAQDGPASTGPPVQPQLIIVRLVSNHCTISIDSSGELLHRRGYRLATAKAPLRETLAAGMIMASGWDAVSPLLDPFCGSGTIPIEAALMARRIPPGRGRRFAFMEWPAFDRDAWSSLLSEIPQVHHLPPPEIKASDRDAGAIRAAKANAERAGVSDCIDFSCRAVSSIDPPPGPGWVITNPPYGVRTKTDRDLRNLYAQFGNVLRAKCPDWRVAVLSASVQFLHSIGLEWKDEIPLVTGGIKVRLVKGKVCRV